MKKPVAKQLPSGAWFCRVRIDGQDICITRDDKDVAEAEAYAIKTGIIQMKKAPYGSITLYGAINEYISQRENVLSPSTIAGYRVIQRNRFTQLHHVKVSDISQDRWQRAVNAEAKNVSPKTLKNSAMFIQTVIAEAGGEKLSARLPQVVPNDLAWLTPEEIPLFLSAIKGSKYEIPALLALSSLRQSEIVAMRWKDIDLKKGTLTVHGAAVLDENGKLVQKKTNKNQSSRRTVPFIIPQLAQAVSETERDPEAFIYPHYSNVLRLNINRVCRDANLPEIGIHGLRRSFASLCYHLGISEAVTMLAGGWSDFRTMRKIYTKISEKDIQDQALKFTAFFQNGNKNANEK